MHIIELQGISKRYGENEVLRDVNLTVEEGEVLGIIGPTGSGKSTLLRIIDLLERPSEGMILFRGSPVTSTVDARRMMGMVFQNSPVFRGTVLDNVLYGPSVRGLKPAGGEADDILELVGLGGYHDRNADELSGGERQRLVLAQALINEPEILLLDEATANLDPLSRRMIEGVIDELRGDITVIFTTHNLLQGQMMADRIAILNRTVMQTGRPGEVFRKPANSFVAEFVGVRNIIEGYSRVREDLSVIECDGVTLYSSEPREGRVYATIRPEDITVSFQRVESGALNRLRGRVTGIREAGCLYHIQVMCGGEVFTVYMTRKSFHDMGLHRGSDVWIEFKASAVHLIDEKER